MTTRWAERALVAAFFDCRALGSLNSALQSDSDWETLIRAAAAEFLLPELGRRLREIPLEIPSEIDAFLASVEDSNRKRNEQILDEAKAIAAVLNGIGIVPVFLKGAAYLVEGVYPTPGCRYLCDLDLLVPGSRLVDAVAALEGQGYSQDARDGMAHFRHHHPQLQRPRQTDGSGSAPVEVHHALGNGVSSRLLSGDELIEGSRELEWRGVRIGVPSPEHLVTHLILHSQIHHCYSERIWPPLRAMRDLAMLDRHFGARLDWPAVLSRFRRQGEEGTLLLHLLQMRSSTGMPLPFVPTLGWIGRARWIRRQFLNLWPALRFIDPVYFFSSTLTRRLRFLKSVLVVPGGWSYATHTLLRRGFYRRLLAEVTLR